MGALGYVSKDLGVGGRSVGEVSVMKMSVDCRCTGLDLADVTTSLTRVVSSSVEGK